MSKPVKTVEMCWFQAKTCFNINGKYATNIMTNLNSAQCTVNMNQPSVLRQSGNHDEILTSTQVGVSLPVQ